jgi:hypothetical protein
MSMLMFHGLDFWTAIRPLLTPWWQQQTDSVRRLLKKSGVL